MHGDGFSLYHLTFFTIYYVVVLCYSMLMSKIIQVKRAVQKKVQCNHANTQLLPFQRLQPDTRQQTPSVVQPSSILPNVGSNLPSHPSWPTFPTFKFPRNDTFLYPALAASSHYQFYAPPKPQPSFGNIFSSISNRWNGWVNNWG